MSSKVRDIRSHTLELIRLVSDLVADCRDREEDEYKDTINRMFCNLFSLTSFLSCDPIAVINAKMTLNSLKYPQELVVKGSEAKYTNYTNITGIHKGENETIQASDSAYLPSCDIDSSCNNMLRNIESFGVERNWTGDYTPKNLIFCIASEVGELCDLVRFMDDEKGIEDLTRTEHNMLAEEIADVSIFLIRFAVSVNIEPLPYFRRFYS